MHRCLSFGSWILAALVALAVIGSSVGCERTIADDDFEFGADPVVTPDVEDPPDVEDQEGSDQEDG